MNNRFVIALDNGTSEQQNAITLHLKKRGFEFWHWIEDLWLLSNVPLGVTPRRLWEELNELPELAGQDMIVFMVNSGIAYWGQLPQNAWRWLGENWGAAI